MDDRIMGTKRTRRDVLALTRAGSIMLPQEPSSPSSLGVTRERINTGDSSKSRPILFWTQVCSLVFWCIRLIGWNKGIFFIAHVNLICWRRTFSRLNSRISTCIIGIQEQADHCTVINFWGWVLALPCENCWLYKCSSCRGTCWGRCYNVHHFLVRQRIPYL